MLPQDDDDFGFSSGDDADLVAFADSQLKRSREADNEGPITKKASFGTSASFDDDLLALMENTSHQNGSAKSVSSALALKILKKEFGLESFQLEQEAVISRLLAGHSAVVVFPTGGGKSLCYQVLLIFSIVLSFRHLIHSIGSSRGLRGTGQRDEAEGTR
jgi:ATP-dependent helicase YprA (DUF1998 family)